MPDLYLLIADRLFINNTCLTLRLQSRIEERLEDFQLVASKNFAAVNKFTMNTIIFLSPKQFLKSCNQKMLDINGKERPVI